VDRAVGDLLAVSAGREYPGRRFKEYYQALLDSGREVSEDKERELRARWEAAEASWQRQPYGRFSGGGGISWVAQRPPAWETIAARLGLDESPSAERLTESPARLPRGRSREELEVEAKVRLELELRKKLENGKPSLRSIHNRMRELGYPVSYRRVRETWLAMAPD
jgi:hypothetical protein